MAAAGRVRVVAAGVGRLGRGRLRGRPARDSARGRGRGGRRSVGRGRARADRARAGSRVEGGRGLRPRSRPTFAPAPTTRARRGDADALSLMLADLRARDEELGRRRAELVGALTIGARDDARVGALVSRRRRSLRPGARHAAGLRAHVRPTLSGFDGLVPVFNADPRQPVHGLRTARTRRRAPERIHRRARGREPPTDLADVHATLVSALRMARSRVRAAAAVRGPAQRGDRRRGLVGDRRRDAARGPGARPTGRAPVSPQRSNDVRTPCNTGG